MQPQVNKMLDPEIAIQIILDSPHPALWSRNEKREVLRFLRKRGKEIATKDISRLLKTILAGPDRAQYPDMVDKEWNRRSDYDIWLRLTKLSQSGVQLPKYAQVRLTRSLSKYGWKLRGDKSEEFPYYMSMGWADHERDKTGFLDFAIMSEEKFSEWSKSQTGRWDSDGGWVTFCDEQPFVALEKLRSISKRGEWPIAPWYDALSRYSNNEKLTRKHHGSTAEILIRMPIDRLAEVDLMVARWLEKVHGALNKRPLWKLWERIWEASKVGPIDDDLDYDMTLNHAGGILAEVLLNELGKIYPSVNVGEFPGIPPQLARYFNYIARENDSSTILARTRLASNLMYLFRVDQLWATRALLSRMDITKPTLEASLWEGYLWSPRLHSDLLVVLKSLFLNLLDNLAIISERVRENAVQLFTIVAISQDRGFTDSESKAVLYSLEGTYLAAVAEALRGMLRDAGDKSPVLWQDNIAPWINNVWPRHPNARTPSVSEQLAWMIMETRDAFPNAVAVIKELLVPEQWTASIYHLERTNLPARFPDASLTLIDKLVGDNTRITEGTLRELLDKIAAEQPKLTKSNRYTRLISRL